MATQAQLTAVQQLYVGYLGRAADAEGQKFWADAIANGTATIASVATGFTLSAEYKAAYAGLDSAALVDKIYNNVLGRSADAEGKAFWVDALANGTVATDTLLATMITNLGALDQQTINNKVFVAQTYTDTVGAAYNPEAGAQVLAGVTSDAATVTEALEQISGGTLAGQVPALALINALANAKAAQTEFEASNKAAADALVAKIAAQNEDAAFDPAATQTDDINANSTYAQKIAAVVADAKYARDQVSDDSTTVLTTKASDAAAATKTALDALDAAGKVKANAYAAAVTAAEATKGANVADVAAVKAGLQTDAAFTPAVITEAAKVDATITNAATLYAFYTNGTTTAEQRTALDTALKDVPYYATFKATAVIDSADKVADQKVVDTKVAIDAVDAGNYSGKLDLQAEADLKLADAKAADADVASAAALKDAYEAVTKVTDAAQDALDDFAANGVVLHDIDGTDTNGTIDAPGATVTKDVFYFADKAVALDPANDFSIGGVTEFGAGDSIVLGKDFTFNNGALSTGDNNKAEFFLVQSNDGVQIVLETANYGSSTASADATTGVVSTNANASDTTTVITLTGVSLADIAVNNGVITHV